MKGANAESTGGGVYEGARDPMTFIADGFGEERLPNGDSYIGDWSAGEKEGKGVYTVGADGEADDNVEEECSCW